MLFWLTIEKWQLQFGVTVGMTNNVMTCLAQYLAHRHIRVGITGGNQQINIYKITEG